MRCSSWGRCFDAVLTRRGERVTVVGATSGDTGSAAIEACRDRAAIDIFILYPHGRISEVQRRQMTTVAAANVHAIAIEGTFDDCQDLVKAMFADAPFRDGAESVGGEFDQLGADHGAGGLLRRRRGGAGRARAARSASPCRPAISAMSMPRTWRGAWACRSRELSSAPTATTSWRASSTTGGMTIGAVEPSLSPSMDIQVSSNFERLYFELAGRDGAAVGRRLRAPSATPARCRRSPALWQRGAHRSSRRTASTTTQTARHHRATPGARPASCSTRTARWRWRRPRAAAARPGAADGGARLRPSGEIPRRGRERGRLPARAAAAARRGAGPARAHRRFCPTSLPRSSASCATGRGAAQEVVSHDRAPHAVSRTACASSPTG